MKLFPRRLGALAISGALILSALTACGGKSATETNSPTPETTPTQ